MRLHDYDASGNCYKVRLLLALTGTPCERVPVDIFAGDTLGEEFARLNPVRETPVLELDDGACVTQSSAILWLLAQGTPYLPGDALGQAHALEWMFFEQERVMPGVGGVRFRTLTGRPVPPGRRELGRDALVVLDAHLGTREFVAGGRCSIADIALFGYAHVAAEAGFTLADFPAVAAWIERVERLPDYMNDLAPYPANALPGAGSSIYDAP